METVESIVPPRSAEDSDQEEWEKINDDVAVARATLVHNMEAHDDAVANLTLSSFESVEADDTTLDERLREMNAAMARLLNKGDEKVEIKEEAAPPGDLVPEEGPSETTEAVAMDTDKAEAPAATGDFVQLGTTPWMVAIPPPPALLRPFPLAPWRRRFSTSMASRRTSRGLARRPRTWRSS